MKEEKDKVHALFTALTAVHVVLGKKTIKQAEKKAYKQLVDIYGEKHLEELFKEENQTDIQC